MDFRAKIMPLRTSSNGTNISVAAAIEAVQYATLLKNRGVNIAAINASFGGSGFNSVEQAAIQSAGDAGIVYCAAAGNDGVNHDSTATYPASYRLPNMIVVAASAQDDTLAWFSDFGPSTVDLAAPGVNILSAKPVNQPGTFLGGVSVQSGGVSYAAYTLAFAGNTEGITGTLYDCGLGYPTDFPVAVQNNIALISRGTLNFSVKVSNAMAVGARAVVIYNNASGNFSGTLGSAGNWIPAISISQEDGQALLAQIPTGATVVNAVETNQVYQYLDGTSMATPHVVGAVAFAAMNFPDESAAQRIQRILANVDFVPALSGYVITSGRLNLLRTVDTDANGLPDWWELENFGQLTGTDPTADPDADGMGNLAEWIAGTSPTNGVSALRAYGEKLTGTNGFLLQWPSVAGKFYRVERTTNLVTGFDSVLRTNIAATPPMNVETDSVALPEAMRFYRVMVEE